MHEPPDNLSIYDTGWATWLDMKQFGPASRWLRALIGDACRYLKIPPLSIHDVGCGEGTTAAYLSHLFPQAQVRGSDFSEGAIAVAKRHLVGQNKTLNFQHDPENQALNQSAQLVCCFEVLEHIENWREFLRRLANSAETYLLLSFPTGRMRPFEVNVGHFRNFQRGEVEAELDTLGFIPVSIAYAGLPFYSPLYRDLCQFTNAGDAQFTRGHYGLGKRFVSAVLYFCFRYLSTQRRNGDQFVGLFVRRGR